MFNVILIKSKKVIFESESVIACFDFCLNYGTKLSSVIHVKD